MTYISKLSLDYLEQAEDPENSTRGTENQMSNEWVMKVVELSYFEIYLY